MDSVPVQIAHTRERLESLALAAIEQYGESDPIVDRIKKVCAELRALEELTERRRQPVHQQQP